MSDPIIKAGKNAWKSCRSNRVSVLIDAANYFRIMYHALQNAKHSILIIGWDVDSRIHLLPEDNADYLNSQLGSLLESQVRKAPDLEVHILLWDFPMLYAGDREPLPLFNLGWKTPSRIHFQMDGDHPVGASHHQKLVVIDDQIAFCGGLDLTHSRWDTHEHLPDDLRRKDTEGNPYIPFHDIHMAVDGETAQALGELCRNHWKRVTGTAPPQPGKHLPDPWPDELDPNFHDVQLGIARTQPLYKALPEIREIEHSYIEMIRSAEDYIFIENQYFTARKIEQALHKRLSGSSCPEIIIILPLENLSWLEEQTMGRLRQKAIQRLREADKHGRLGFYTPVTGSEDDPMIKVHSKFMIIDDRMLRVGSANLNNRSMGLDTECDLILESSGDGNTIEGIIQIRDKLLAEHLDVDHKKVEESMAETGSILKTIAKFQKSGRTLIPFEIEASELAKEIPVDDDLLDPEKPVHIDQMMDSLVLESEPESQSSTNWLKYFGIAILVLGLMAVWFFTPLKDMIDRGTVENWIQSVKDRPFTFLYVILGYVLGGLVFFPVTVLVGATVTVFSPWLGFITALSGCLISGLLLYLIGRWLKRPLIRRLAGTRLNRISEQIGKRGVIAIAAIRNLPIAPFSLVNLVAGATHISLRDFILGTIVGMSPGILGFTLIMDRLRGLINQPTLGNIALLVIVIILFIALSKFAHKRLMRKGDQDKKDTS